VREPAPPGTGTPRRCDLRDHRAVIIGALVLLVVVTLMARRSVGHPLVSRLRALLPAWRFFDRVAPSPYLLCRWAVPGARFGAWSPIDGGPRGAASCVFAPRANLLLACHAAIEQLVAELGELELVAPGGPDAIDTDPAVVHRVSYELVSRIARSYLPVAIRGAPGVVFQWKLIVPGDPPDPGDSLVSVELAA